MNFEINTDLLYCSEGVCRVDDVEERDFFGEKKAYYLLTPIYHTGGRVFVPVDGPTSVRLHLPATKEEAERALKICDHMSWIENETERKNLYREKIDTGTACDRMVLYRTLVRQEELLATRKKNLRSADEKFKKELERLLSEELAYALGCEPQEMLFNIRACVESFEK